MLFETRWIALTGVFWEHETDIRLFPLAILCSWTGTLNQCGSIVNFRYPKVQRSADLKRCAGIVETFLLRSDFHFATRQQYQRVFSDRCKLCGA